MGSAPANVGVRRFWVCTCRSRVEFSSTTSWRYGAMAMPLMLMDRNWLCSMSRSSSRIPVHLSSHAAHKKTRDVSLYALIAFKHLNVCVCLLLLTHTLSSLQHVPFFTLVTWLTFEPGLTVTLSSQGVAQRVKGTPHTAATLRTHSTHQRWVAIVTSRTPTQ